MTTLQIGLNQVTQSDGTLVTEAVDRLTNHDDDVIFVAFNVVDAQGHSCCFDPGNSAYRNVISHGIMAYS